MFYDKLVSLCGHLDMLETPLQTDLQCSVSVITFLTHQLWGRSNAYEDRQQITFLILRSPCLVTQRDEILFGSIVCLLILGLGTFAVLNMNNP